MNITCPQCKTVYRLPESSRKKNIKFRCSVCRHVFLADQGFPKDEPKSEAHDSDRLEFQPQNTNEDNGLSLNFDDYLESEKSPLHKENADTSLCSSIKDIDDESAPLGRESNISQDMPSLDMPKSKNSGCLRSIVYLILWGAIFGGSFYLWNYTDYLNIVKPHVATLINNVKSMCGLPVDKELPKKSAVDSIVFAETKQYKIKNKFMGHIIVISGTVRNDADSPRELIKVTGSLTDDENNVLASETQVVGVTLLKEQLENFNTEEMAKYLQNKYEIMKNNIDLKPGDTSPFTIVFTHVPATATGFKVEIVDAVVPNKTGNLTE